MWIDIKGYEGSYKLNQKGQVKTMLKNNFGVGHMMKPALNTNGYYHVRLRKNGSYKHFLIHRLLAIHYIPNPLNKPWINHKDSVRTNNKISNLEWCTPTENNKHCSEKGRNPPIKGEKAYNALRVDQLTLDGKLVKTWDCLKHAAEHFNVTPTAIRAVFTNRKFCYQSCGYKWRLAKKQKTKS